MLSPCKHLLRGEMLGYKSLYICKKLIEFECSGYITYISIELYQPTTNLELWCYVMHTINRCILFKKECPGTQYHEGALHVSVLAARLFDIYVK